MLAAENACTEGSLQVDSESVYELERRGNFAVESTMEVFGSTIDKEDYRLGELQQKSA